MTSSMNAASPVLKVAIQRKRMFKDLLVKLLSHQHEQLVAQISNMSPAS